MIRKAWFVAGWECSLLAAAEDAPPDCATLAERAEDAASEVSVRCSWWYALARASSVGESWVSAAVAETLRAVAVRVRNIGGRSVGAVVWVASETSAEADSKKLSSVDADVEA